MKKIYFAFLFLFLFFPIFSQDNDSLSYISLAPSQFSEELSIVSHPVIIDVREFFEYKKSRINGAVNMPSSNSIDMPVDTTDKAAHLFLYCTSGFRSKRVAAKFAEKGFIHVYSLDGGITAWKKEGFPLDRKRLRRNSVTRSHTELKSSLCPSESRKLSRLRISFV